MDETTNLARSEPGRLESLLSRLPLQASDSVERGRIDEETIAKLRSLGYVASVADRSPDRPVVPRTLAAQPLPA